MNLRRQCPQQIKLKRTAYTIGIPIPTNEEQCVKNKRKRNGKEMTRK